MNISWFNQLVANSRGPGSKQRRQRLQQTLRSNRRRARIAVQGFEKLEERRVLAIATWDGGSALNSNWMTAANWVGDVAPSAGDELRFDTSVVGVARFSSTNNFPNYTSFGKITINDSSSSENFSLSGNAVTLNGGIETGGGQANFGLYLSAIRLGADQSFAAPTVFNSGDFYSFDTSSAIDTNGFKLTTSGVSYFYYGGVISGSGGLKFTSNGDSWLNVANTYTGITEVTSGNVGLQGTGTLGSTSGNTIVTNGIVRISDNISSAEPITLTGSNAFLYGRGNAVLSGAITLSTTTAAYFENGGFASGDVFTVSGPISGTAGSQGVTLSFAAVDRITQFSGANSYTGATNINSGTLRLGASNVLPDSSAVTVASSSALALNGFSDTIGSLSGSSGTVQLGNGALTIGANNTSTTYGGVISGAGSLIKTGIGTLTLSGSSSNYGGGTQINGGMLAVTGVSTGTGPVTVNSSAALIGTGTVSGSVTVNSGGLINPGTVGGTGTITVGGLTFNGGTYAADFNSNASDTISTAGSVNLNGGTAGVFAVNSATGTVTANNIFTLINNTGSGAIGNVFTGVPEGATIIVGSTPTLASYIGGGGGKSFTLTYVPGTLTPTLTSGNLTITDTDGVKNNNLSISTSGSNYVITDTTERFGGTGGISGATLSNGAKTLTVPIASITGTQVIINGMGGEDTLTVDVTNALVKTVTFNGGDPTTAPGDELLVAGGSFATGTLNHTNATDGSVVLGTNTINYTGLEPVDVTGSTITELVINLPDNAAVGDKTKLSFDGANLKVESTNATHESDLIAVAGLTKVTVNARQGDDTITLDPSMSTFTKTLILNGDAGADSFKFESSLAAPGTTTVNGGAGTDTLDYSTYKVGMVNTSVAISLTAAAANGFTGTTKDGANTITSFTEIDAANGNTTAVTDSLDVSGLGLPQVALTQATPPAVGGSGFDGTVTAIQTFDFTGTETLKSTPGNGGKLTGLDTNNSWIINESGITSSAYNSIDAARSLNFSGFATVQGRSKSDNFVVVNNLGNSGITLNSGLGALPDSFVVGDAMNKIDSIATLTLNGESPTASVQINDFGNTTDQKYTLTAASISRTAGAPINFNTVSSLTLVAGSGKNTATISGIPGLANVTGPTTLNLGTGADTVDVSTLNPTVVTLTNLTAPAMTIGATGFDGNAKSGGNTFNFIGAEVITGSTTAGDELHGLNEISTWKINESGSTSYEVDAESARPLTFTGLDKLFGNDKADKFNVTTHGTTPLYELFGGDDVDQFTFFENSLAASTNNVQVDGQGGDDKLTINDLGTATARNYLLDANSIERRSVADVAQGKVTYTDITDLLLDASNGANTIKVTAVPGATGTKTLNGNVGTDILDLSGFGVSSVNISKDNAAAGFDGDFSGVDFTSINAFVGVNGSTFKGDDQDSTWTVNDGGTSTYATAARTANISGFNILQGNLAKDAFNVLNNSTTANYSLKGGAGVDAFNFGNANKLDGITNPISVDGETNGATLSLSDQGNMTPFNYAVNSTTINRVGGGVVTYDDITDLTLNASNGSNIITVNGMPTVTGVATLNGGTGDDTLEVADVNPVTVSNLAFTIAPATTGFNGTVTSGTPSFNFTGVEAINAKSGTPADTLIGMDAASTWTIDESAGNTSKYVNNSSPARPLRFSGFDTLQGQSFIDTFNVLNNSLTSSFSLKGGGSLDAFNFGNGNNLDGITNPISVDGEGAFATLTLNDQGHSNPINYTAGTSTIGRTGGGTVTYDDITALTLNASNGTNKITVTGMPSASGPVVFNGGTGADTLDLTATALNPVKVTLTAATLPLLTATGFDGKVESGGKNFNFTAVESIDARNGVDPNGLGDELIGININATWTINEALPFNTYLADLPAPNPDRNLNWAGFEKLTGNAGIDTFKVQNNSTSNPLTLDGQGGADSFTIADGGNKLRTVIKSLTVAGGTDASDELILNDQDEAGDKNYSISPTSVSVLEANGVVVNHSFVEKITLNASDGGNLISVLDSNPTNTNYTVSPGGTATTIKLLDTLGDAKVRINDVDDNANNNWTVTATTVTRTAPTPQLIVDYSGLAFNSSLALAGGSATETVAIEATDTGTTTTISGNGGNDVFTVAKGDLDASIKGPLSIEGGGNLAATRTVFRGGLVPTATQYTFTPTSTSVEIGDSLTINDSLEGGLTKYAINSTSVSRTGAPQPINHKEIEFLKLQAGSGASDITATMPLPTDLVQLPTIVQVDGGGNPLTTDNRFQIKGSTGADAITIGDATTVETNRSQFEVASITRMWVEGNVGNDVIHNRTVSVPALLDGGRAKDATLTPALANSAVTNEDDVIISDAQSTQNDYSSVLLGNDGKDFLLTKNNNSNLATGTTLPRLTSFLIGDYFINNNVRFSSAVATPAASRLQVVNNPLLPQTNTTTGVRMRSGESGDRFVTQHTPVTASRNRAIVRLDDAPNTYGPGKFEKLAVDITNLTVIKWLQGRLNITVSPVGIANELAFANFYIRQFVREPGSAAAPTYPNATYTPLGANATPPTNPSFPENGGEFVEGTETAPQIVQNPFDAADVNGDGRITAFDALLVINELNLKGPHLLDTSSTAASGDGEEASTHFLDVTGDSAVTAFDALLVINRLNLGDTQIRNQDALGNAFAEIDAAQLADNEAFATELAASQPAASLTDDALLALLAADTDDSDEGEDLFSF